MTTDSTFGIIATSVLKWLNAAKQANGGQVIDEFGAVVATSTGLVRTENQDRCLIARSAAQRWTCFVLCDGIGGMANGGAAAEIAASKFVEALCQGTHSDAQSLLLRAVESANSEVYRRFGEKSGTTIAAVYADRAGRLFGVTVGDSRIYQISGRTRLEQLSDDDTIADELRRIKGVELTPEQLNSTTRQLAQYVGMGPGIHPRIYGPLAISESWIMLTTDGIHSMPSRVLTQIAVHAPTPHRLGTRLIQVSEWLGGFDNASLLIMPGIPEQLPIHYSESKAEVLDLWSYFGKMQLVICAQPIGSREHQPAPTQSSAGLSSVPPQNEIKGTERKKATPQRKAPPKRSQKRRLKESPPQLGMELIEVEPTESLEPKSAYDVGSSGPSESASASASDIEKHKDIEPEPPAQPKSEYQDSPNTGPAPSVTEVVTDMAVEGDK